MVLETSVLSTFNHLTRLEARESFINLSRRESLKSYVFSGVQIHYSRIVSLTIEFSPSISVKEAGLVTYFTGLSMR
jgi:hypothetical protein